MMPPAADTFIVTHNVVHLRAEPRSGAEMVSQVLMGDTVTVLETQGDWSRIEGIDTYRGWAETRWLAPIPTNGLVLRRVKVAFSPVRLAPDTNATLVARLPLQAGVFAAPSLPDRKWVEITFPGDCTPSGWMPFSTLDFSPKIGATHLPDTATNEAQETALFAVTWAQELRGTPYLWGGSSAFGLDCSGLVQLCYRHSDLTLRRDADIQRDDPRFVPVTGDFAPGDLLFFGTPDKVGHVGMAMGDSRFIHAAGGAGVIITPVGDTRYWPGFLDARRLDPARLHDPVTRFEAEDR